MSITSDGIEGPEGPSRELSGRLTSVTSLCDSQVLAKWRIEYLTGIFSNFDKLQSGIPVIDHQVAVLFSCFLLCMPKA